MSQKLKGIYDALDHYQYKNALKLCAALLKKEPTHALCKALNAVALERSGRRDEALQSCDEALVGTGVDDTVLNTVQVVFKRCRQYSKITQMYEAAWTKEPDNKDYGVALFSASVRECDFAKAQQVATKLYRKFNLQKFLHWVVVSILLQARGKKDAKVLDLAEMMLQKAPVEPLKAPLERLNRSQQYLLLLHLTTLRSKAKYTEALEMLEAFKGYIPFDSDVIRTRVQLLEEGGRVSEAAKESRKLVLSELTNWSASQDCVRIAFRCSSSVADTLPTLSWAPRDGVELQVPNHCSRLRGPLGKEAQDVVLDTMEDVERQLTDDEVWNSIMFFRHLKQVTPLGPQRRVPQLAELELWRLAFRENECAASVQLEDSAACTASWQTVVSDRGWEDFIGLIVDYIRDHGSKNYCYYDIKPFICLLEEHQAAPIFKALAEVKACRAAEITMARLRRGFLRHRSEPSYWDATQAEVSRLLGEWKAPSMPGKVEGEDKEKPEAPEEFLILAIMGLVDLDRESCLKSQVGGRQPEMGDRSHLLDALALAEMGIAKLPHCYQFKVILVLIYAAMGLPTAMLRWYHTLEIKNIQHESLSYLALDALSASGCQDTVRDMCRSITQFHEDFDKDTSDVLHVAFQSEVYHRIPEYAEALEVVGRSALWGRAIVEDTLATMGQAQTIEALTESAGRQDSLLATIAQKPTDFWLFRNQDRSMLSGWQPLPHCSPLGAEASHASRDSWRGRRAVPTALAVSGRSSANTSSAVVWEPAAEPSPTPLLQSGTSSASSSSSHSGRFSRSAVEDLLSIGLERSSGQLRSMSSLVIAVQALLQKDSAGMAKAVQAAREALEAEGISLVDLEASTEFATENSTIDNVQGTDDASCRLAMPWCRVPPSFAALVRRCAVAAVETASSALQSLSSGEAWELTERGLAAITALVKSSVDAIREERSEKATAGTSLLPMRHGTQMLWMFINECLAVLIPVAVWCATIPKGSGKKAKDEGREALHATRVAIKALLTTTQTALSDLHSDICSAEKQLADPCEGSPAKMEVLENWQEFQKSREQVTATVIDSHRKHLAALKEAISMRLALLKTKASFKP